MVSNVSMIDEKPSFFLDNLKPQLIYNGEELQSLRH